MLHFIALLWVGGTAAAPSAYVSGCKSLISYQSRRIAVGSVKIPLAKSTGDQPIQLGGPNISTQLIREASALIEAFDMYQFSTCQTLDKLPKKDRAPIAGRRDELMAEFIFMLRALDAATSDTMYKEALDLWSRSRAATVVTRSGGKLATAPVFRSNLANAAATPNREHDDCDGRSPCSPDGKWFAAITTVQVDASTDTELRNPVVSCSGNYCPWLKVLSTGISADGKHATAQVLTWSGPVVVTLTTEVWGRP